VHFNDNRIIRAAKSSTSGKTLRFRFHTRASTQRTARMRNQGSMLDRIDVEVELTGSLTAEQHAKLMQVAAKCPVHRTLTSEINIRLRARGEASKLDKQDCSHRPAARSSSRVAPTRRPTGPWLQRFFRSVVLPDRTRRTSDRRPVTRDVSLDVILHVFLKLGRQIAQA